MWPRSRPRRRGWPRRRGRKIFEDSVESDIQSLHVWSPLPTLCEFNLPRGSNLGFGPTWILDYPIFLDACGGLLVLLLEFFGACGGLHVFSRIFWCLRRATFFLVKFFCACGGLLVFVLGKFFAPVAGYMYYPLKFLGACGGLHVSHCLISISPPFDKIFRF